MLMENLENIRKELKKMDERFEEAKQKISTLDKLRVQIEHEIELNAYDAVGMAKKYKEFKGVLILRRKYKDEVDLFATVFTHFKTSSLDTAMQSLKDKSRFLENRVFNERASQEVRVELAEEVKKYLEKI